jgi:hypothetical protein
VNFDCMIRQEGNEMLSIYSGVIGIYTPRHSGDLHYRCIAVHTPSLHKVVHGGCNHASLEMHLEDVMVRTSRL